MYIRRNIESTIKKRLQQRKAVLVTGARQVGKTTMLTKAFDPPYHYVSLDDPAIRSRLNSDAMLFFSEEQLPLILDEVQQLPSLFQTIKYVIDQRDDYGQMILTGSQTYHLMKGISESLAGRVSVLQMTGLSLRELYDYGDARPFLPDKMKTDFKNTEDPGDIWDIAHKGSMPALIDPKIEWQPFYADYVRTYLERDVRDLTRVKDEIKFYNFMVACAARSGQLFNASDVARVVGIDHKTVQDWISILQASGIAVLLHPFWANTDKRLAKTPKLYFLDTGLVCYLTGWLNAEQLRLGAAAGHVYETFVVSEIIKSYLNAGRDISALSFYRDSKKREIDLVIREGRTLHPVEIKMASHVDKTVADAFAQLSQFRDFELGSGAVICQTQEPYLLTQQVEVLSPWDI